MKKIIVLIVTTLMVVALTLPASAFESEVGLYWRTRFYTQQNFNGEGNGGNTTTEANGTVVTEGNQDTAQVDTRTRLFYTAHFTESFAFYSAFEMDANWGDNRENSYGDIATDGVAVEIKHLFANFDLADLNWKIGAQHKTQSRGLLFDDDFAGLIARYVGDTMVIPFIWIKAYEGGPGGGGPGTQRWKGDVDYYMLDPTFQLTPEGNISLNPFVVYIYSKDAEGWDYTAQNSDVKVFFVGVNADLEFDWATLWFTGIYEVGKVQSTIGNLDVSAGLAAAGASTKVGEVELHGQAFYATGDDDQTDGDSNNFYVPKGQSYYWSEIMGLGMFDNQASAGSPADQISNIIAGNLGATMQPMDKLTMSLDVWYAKHAESDTNGKRVLGTEVDLRATYKLLEKLDLDLVGAYLFAGDATSLNGDNKENPYEIGAQVSFKF